MVVGGQEIFGALPQASGETEDELLAAFKLDEEGEGGSIERGDPSGEVKILSKLLISEDRQEAKLRENTQKTYPFPHLGLPLLQCLEAGVGGSGGRLLEGQEPPFSTLAKTE